MFGQSQEQLLGRWLSSADPLIADIFEDLETLNYDDGQEESFSSADLSGRSCQDDYEVSQVSSAGPESPSMFSVVNPWEVQRPADLVLDKVPKIKREPKAAPKAEEESPIETDETQDFIDEMEEFLQNYSSVENGGEASMEEEDIVDQVLGLERDFLHRSTLPSSVDEETEEAERLLDALIDSSQWDLENDFVGSKPPPPPPSPSPSPPSCSQKASVSCLFVEYGNEIVIVVDDSQVEGKSTATFTDEAEAMLHESIVEEMKAQMTPYSVDSSSPVEDDEDDDVNNQMEVSNTSVESEVTENIFPQPIITIQRKKPGRKLCERSQYSSGSVKKKHNTASVKDKKERKKLQNVEAARRYRDRKRARLVVCEEEEQELQDKNTVLKKKLSDLRAEYDTVSKLLMDLGLIQVVKLSSK